MLGRILLLAGAIWLLIYLLRRASRPATTEHADAGDDAMLQCKYCGVHAPRAECVFRDGDAYCSAAHRDADG